MAEKQEKPKGKIDAIKQVIDEYTDKMKGDERIKKRANFIWNNRIEIISGALILAGIILAFFYMHIGGLLVGLGFGIGFFEEILSYFSKLRDFYSERGLSKTLILIGTVIYFLIVLPSFIVAAAVGFGVMFLIRRALNR